MKIDNYFQSPIKLYGIGLNLYKGPFSSSKDFEDENNITGLSEILIPFKDPKNINNYYGKLKTNDINLYCFKTLSKNGILKIDCNKLYLNNIDRKYFNFIVEVQAIDMGDNIPGDIKLLRKIYINNEDISNNKSIEIQIYKNYITYEGKN